MKKRIPGSAKIMAVILVFMFLVISFPRWIKLFYPMPHQDTVDSLSQKYQVDPLLVFAIIRAESKYQPDAHSPVGARGLMQIMPETAEWIAKKMKLKDFQTTDLYEPKTNIAMGCWYINNLSNEFDDCLPVTIAAYNAGRGNVKKWLANEQWDGTSVNLQDIPFEETRNYVKNVLKNYQAYKAIYK